MFPQQPSPASAESEDDDGFLELLDDQDLKVCAKETRQTFSHQLCGVFNSLADSMCRWCAQPVFRRLCACSTWGVNSR